MQVVFRVGIWRGIILKLDAINARNTLQNADIALKRAMFSLASYLNFDKNTGHHADSYDDRRKT